MTSLYLFNEKKNKKDKKLQKIIKIKFVIPCERPIFTPEYLKSGLNGSS